ncbi:hypothetical protein Rsub_08445 [Raphidocelis subcapitata]|uniref:DUF155 domain-containing protein n=1 Tax=Raphidocelis subcapitata TaxID=307507 RepID=A0A2V0P7L1_9CHLO|nr:hypothetical protein Rsub_08445 [Raphidocelis subcapitata]|eukprot:GBF95854.1 hypothetical protein Rsub_08445 [Raphidocelis subcapitata]
MLSTAHHHTAFPRAPARQGWLGGAARAPSLRRCASHHARSGGLPRAAAAREPQLQPPAAASDGRQRPAWEAASDASNAAAQGGARYPSPPRAEQQQPPPQQQQQQPIRAGAGPRGRVRKHAAASAVRDVPAPGQPPRQRDKTVLLPTADGDESSDSDAAASEAEADGGDGSGRGRVTTCCVAESLRRAPLEDSLRQAFPGCRITRYPDMLHAELAPDAGADGQRNRWGPELFFFDYGVVTCWGLCPAREAEVAALARAAAREALPTGQQEVDEFQFATATAGRGPGPSLSNDTIRLTRRQAGDHRAKLSLSHALAQSAKLSLYEARVVELVARTQHLPQTMAERGEVAIGAREVARLIGQVFLQRSAVNLLSRDLLDTPEYFWSAPDALQELYEAACEYLELGERVEVLNARLEVLQDLLDMLRDYTAHQHSSNLEIIIIVLVAGELGLGLLQLSLALTGAGAGH